MIAFLPSEKASGPPPLGRRYASPLIAERRSRILGETKRLIGEVGMNGFTLRDLARCAGVSVTTIYNIFGDKEGVIAHALREFHEGIRLNLPGGGANLTGICRSIMETTEIVIANRSYAHALAELYFSSSLADTIFEVIRAMPLQVFSHWLRVAQRDGVLAGTIDESEAERLFANLEWASIKDWAGGRITDAALPVFRQRNFLVMAASLCRPARSREAQDLLAKLSAKNLETVAS
jgi:AcrR family transcriptional regulator